MACGFIKSILGEMVSFATSSKPFLGEVGRGKEVLELLERRSNGREQTFARIKRCG